MKFSKSNYNYKNNNIYSLDERESYFSYILSPFRKKNHSKKPLEDTKMEITIKHGDHKKCEGDINYEAEMFIRRKRKMLELSKTMVPIITE